MLFSSAPFALVITGAELPGGNSGVFNIDFEDDALDGFTARGSDVKLEIVTTAQPDKSNGKSLKVTGRKDAEDGVELNISADYKQYYANKITVWVKTDSTASSKFSLMTDTTIFGTKTTGTISSASISASDGWVQISGSYRYYNEDKVVIYVKSEDASAVFYIDDLSSSASGSADKYNPNLPSLYKAYEDYFLLGNITNYNEVESAGKRYELLKRHFNALTFENDMKPAYMWSSGSSAPNLTRINSVVKKLNQDGFSVIGHTLAWHGQSAAWLNTGKANNYETAKANLEKYINTIAGNFYQREDTEIYSWDVLNEAIARNGKYPATDWRNQCTGAFSGTSDWFSAYKNVAEGTLNEYGDPVEPWNYVYDAFYYARLADPKAVLYYNDYNMQFQDKADLVVAMVNDINALYKERTGDTRLLIEGIGMQEHDDTGTNLTDVEKSLKKFAATGAVISITELDVGVSGKTKKDKLTERQEISQALYFARLFRLLIKYSYAIERVSFWGIDDQSSWRENLTCLFNGDLTPKLAFFAVLDPEGFISQYGTGTMLDANLIRLQAPIGSVASLGTPALGSSESASIWANAQSLTVNRNLLSDSKTSGVAKVLWDDDYLYVQVKVTDSVLNSSAKTASDQDSVEIFLNEYNTKNAAFADGMSHYRVNYNNDQSFGKKTSADGFESWTAATSDGYTVEMKIPFNFNKPAEGSTIRFDIQINDADSSGTKKDVIMWSDMFGESSTNGTNWGWLDLVSVSPSAEENTELQPDDSSEESAAPDDAGTSLNPIIIPIIIVLSIAIISAAAIMIIKRKKK